MKQKIIFIVETSLKSSKHITEVLDEFQDISDNESIDIIIIPTNVDLPLDFCGTFEVLTDPLMK